MKRRDTFPNPQYRMQNPRKLKENKIQVKKIDDKEDLLNELNVSVNISDYIKYKSENIDINTLIIKLIKNKKNNIEESLDKLLNEYNFSVNEYDYISFLDICMLLNIFYKQKKEINNTIKYNVKNLIKKSFDNIILHLKNNYFCNLVFNYIDNDNNININIEYILNNTIKNLRENFKILENILINIIEDTDTIISVFAGRLFDIGINAEEEMKKINSFIHKNSNCKSLWASPRSSYDVYRAINSNTDIITISEDLINKFKLFDKKPEKYSLETVNMFYNDAKKSKFKI